MFSIIIPTLNNLEYLKLCIKSLKKNSSFNHQIIAHVNVGNDGTIKLLKDRGIDFTYTNYNSTYYYFLDDTHLHTLSNY